MICSVCGTKNPDEARFCLRCGNPLRTRTEGERRIVTMLFCDVVGSTATAEHLDPEAWTEIMNEIFELMTAPIDRYEGTIARLMGDAIFAFFGAPKAHEDDPSRAVNAGLEIIEAIASYRAKHDVDLNVRVGINTGPVVVGEVGSELRVEYTAMGDAVNVAARMEQTADPGTVQITAETAGLVRGSFEFGQPRPVQVKGKAETVKARVVIGRRHVRSTDEPTPRARLVGRDPEMRLLRRAVDETLEGRGRSVALIGEAGLGKSRLVEETRRYWFTRRPKAALEGSDIRRMWETWRCVSYDRTRPYAQYRRMLSSFAGIADVDPPNVVRKKLAETIDPDAPEWLEPHMRVWRSLFGVPEEGEEPLEGEGFRDAIMDLVPRSTRSAGAEPRLMIFEDLHWCDDASMDLLIETAKAVNDQPSLLLFAFRPDEQAPSSRLRRWMHDQRSDRSTEITLAPLSARESGELLDELLPEDVRSDGVRASILQRTEGNPLFLEELAAAIQANTPSDAVPATLQALITARLDTLDEDARRTLQLASVVGRSFDEPVLRAVAGDGEHLRDRLEALQRAGLIAETARSPEPGYAFHHSLIQEAAYGTILLRERRALHLEVGVALEQLYTTRLEEFAPVLAHHFREAGDDEQTLRYARLAGDDAARLYAHTDAITHYSAAIEAARRLDPTSDLFDHLYSSRGRALQLAGRYDEAEANYEDMRKRAEAAGDRGAALQATMSLTTLYTTATSKFDVEKGRRASHQAIALARKLDDRSAESKALWNLMNLLIYGSGDQREAMEAGELSLALARELDDREQMAFTMTDLWRPYAWAGDLDAARRTLDEARPIWRELDNLPMLTENLGSSAFLSHFFGDEDEALLSALECRSVSDSTGNMWGQAYASMTASEVYLDRGEVGTAVELMRDAIDTGERLGFLAPLVTTRATLGVVYGYLGDLESAKEAARITLEVATDRIPSARPWPVMCLAEIHMLGGELDEADAILADCDVDLLPGLSRPQASLRVALVHGGIALARGDHDLAIAVAAEVLGRLDRMGARQSSDEASFLKGKALAAIGRTSEAERELRLARSTAESLGHRRILWEILAELGRIVPDEEGTTLRREARDIIRAIARTLDANLEASFLQRTDVRALLTVRSGEPNPRFRPSPKAAPGIGGTNARRDGV